MAAPRTVVIPATDLQRFPRNPDAFTGAWVGGASALADSDSGTYVMLKNENDLSSRQGLFSATFDVGDLLVDAAELISVEFVAVGRLDTTGATGFQQFPRTPPAMDLWLVSQAGLYPGATITYTEDVNTEKSAPLEPFQTLEEAQAGYPTVNFTNGSNYSTAWGDKGWSTFVLTLSLRIIYIPQPLITGGLTSTQRRWKA